MKAPYRNDHPENYSRRRPEVVYCQAERETKAKKILAVLSDFLPAPLDQLGVLDLGCSSGIITNSLGRHFKTVTGLDIDREALTFAAKNKALNAGFTCADALKLPFRGGSFDVVVCAHVYEHVTDSQRLMNEIYRVLKKEGVCFFAAGNKLRVVEPHYEIPMLSILPQALADGYLRFLRLGKRYQEKHLTYWGLKQLVSRFYLMDYTFKIIQNPEKFAATDLCTPGSLKQRLALLLSRVAYGLVPTYIFILKKVKP
jgi:ubiquinone/menaquinone biosynthesis C-methylase UbiE